MVTYLIYSKLPILEFSFSIQSKHGCLTQVDFSFIMLIFCLSLDFCSNTRSTCNNNLVVKLFKLRKSLIQIQKHIRNPFSSETELASSPFKLKLNSLISVFKAINNVSPNYVKSLFPIPLTTKG